MHEIATVTPPPPAVSDRPAERVRRADRAMPGEERSAVRHDGRYRVCSPTLSGRIRTSPGRCPHVDLCNCRLAVCQRQRRSRERILRRRACRGAHYRTPCIQALHVTARSSAFAFRGKALNVRAIGKALNVGAVLEGSVRRSGNRLRIAVQLVNVADRLPPLVGTVTTARSPTYSTFRTRCREPLWKASSSFAG